MPQGRKFILAATVTVLAGCGTAAGAYRVFSDDLDRLIGTPFDTAHVAYIGNLSETKPLESRTLENGNKIIKYEMAGVRRDGPPCLVFVEVENDKHMVVEASYRGSGCWRPY